MPLRALIFDVDGTLAETEEIHRAAFNRVFAEDGLNWNWDVDLYRDLLKVTGGRERMLLYAGRVRQELEPDRLARLHARKNEIYGALVRSGQAALRPGVEDLIRRAHDAGLKLAICTTTSRANIEALIEATLGADGMELFDAIVAGEDVKAKKPAPDAYLAVIAALDQPADACLALEDSRNGLAASRTAGVKTIVTPGLYTAHEDFEGAAAILPDLVDFDWRRYS
jgi:HAD superfamily hydrolase (TIGR01509 family)